MKRELFDAAGVAVPASVTFKTTRARECAVQSGLDPFRPVFVSWLGVTVYLTREAVAVTLAQLGRFAPGSEIATDRLLRNAAGNSYAEAVGPMAAGQGEP